MDNKIIRVEQTDQGALGVLILNGIYFCSTLEPDSTDDKRFQIPAGIYYCERYSGTKYKDTFEIKVPDHTALLFHSGNIEEDSLACVLLGQYPGKLRGNRAVLNSGVTFEKFKALMKNTSWFYLEIIDLFK